MQIEKIRKYRVIRGDCDWGHDKVMTELEQKDYQYLFKLKKTQQVKALIHRYHGVGEWTYFNDRFEAQEPVEQQSLAFIDSLEDIKVYEYAVLVTNLESDVVSIVQHYRDRADCENYFDEIKNQWGWGGFTRRDIKSSRLMARMIALIYNGWTLFVRLANPDHHLEAVTSRPLLLSSVGRLTQSGRQKRMLLTTQHGQANKIKIYCQRVTDFFKDLKLIAPQLTLRQRWCYILAKAMEVFLSKMKIKIPQLQLTPS